MASQYGYNAAFMYAAQMPVPLPPPAGSDQRTQAGSPSPLELIGSPRRPRGHSFRQSSRQRPPQPAGAAIAIPARRMPATVSAASPTSIQPATSQSSSSSSYMRHPRFADFHGFDSTAPAASAESVSSASGTTMSSDLLSAPTDGPLASRPYIVRNGRTFLNDLTLPYPLPADLQETHRQSLRTLLLIQLFGAPVCSPSLVEHPPRAVLEIGCGSGFWSMMCHRFFQDRGHGDVSFTGIDIVPLAPENINPTTESGNQGRHMQWSFVKHDLRQLPWPLPSEAFDLVMVKDMSLATTNNQRQLFLDEYVRLVRPGGVLEIWDSDHLIRMLRPHVPDPGAGGDGDEKEFAANLGAYFMTINTPLSSPLNSFLVDYNNWLSQALATRGLSPVPCALIGSALLQESDTLVDFRSRRLAVPLSAIRWESDGIDAVITTDGKPVGGAEMRPSQPLKTELRTPTASQEALRRTALLTVVQQIQALESILREVSGKSQDEWDAWLGKMMSDLLAEGGTNWGECLEVGAWWATKMKRRGRAV